jgi:type III restriction enzyme
MVVEYKGGHLADTADTNEKRTIGQLWEKSSGGRCLFIVVEKEVAGRDMWAQLRAKMAGSDLVGAFRA